MPDITILKETSVNEAGNEVKYPFHLCIITHTIKTNDCDLGVVNGDQGITCFYDVLSSCEETPRRSL